VYTEGGFTELGYVERASEDALSSTLFEDLIASGAAEHEYTVELVIYQIPIADL